MALFNKPSDPISERSRALNAEIAALESKIKRLNDQLQPGQGPRVRSTTLPPGRSGHAPAPAQSQTDLEPVFEPIDQGRLKEPAEHGVSPEHFNELGARKYDLVALIDRLRKRFQGPPVSNPRLVNYLAAGSVQGLRPLRFEKRIARRRVLWLTISFLLLMLGILRMVLQHR